MISVLKQPMFGFRIMSFEADCYRGLSNEHFIEDLLPRFRFVRQYRLHVCLSRWALAGVSRYLFMVSIDVTAEAACALMLVGVSPMSPGGGCEYLEGRFGLQSRAVLAVAVVVPMRRRYQTLLLLLLGCRVWLVAAAVW
jgi:hypothetical protein